VNFFKIEKRDPFCQARAALLTTAHGTVRTPAFMPVGTQASVKTLSPDDLQAIRVQMILNNTYHLYLRPGPEVIRRAGGLQKFSAWDGPILTDSGGYQVFSLSELNKITGDGFHFRSHIDGSSHFFSPEKVVEIQRNLGSDIMMVLDECAPYPCEYSYAHKAHKLTVEWAARSREAMQQIGERHGYAQLQFAIVQGSIYEDLRRASAQALAEMDFPGYAIGGLSVGEPKPAMLAMTEICCEILPADKPRYLMGVGKPEDLLTGIERGIDLFDCIMPTRNGRNGTAFTANGQKVIKNAKFREDFTPLDESCDCYTCRTFSRAYLRHLFNAQEVLVLRLISLHNVYFYMRLMEQARRAIVGDEFMKFKKEFLETYQNNQTNDKKGD